MLDNILDGLKGQVVDTLKEKTGLDASQAEQAMPLAKDSITSGLMGAVSGGNISGVLGMFSGGGDMMQNAVYSGIATNFISQLTAKLGIPDSMASTVSSVALPMILNKIKGSAADGDGQVSESGLMSMLGGSDGLADGLKDQAGDMLQDKAKDLLGGIGGMFGGK